jgi:organic radical activating enzyme
MLPEPALFKKAFDSIYDCFDNFELSLLGGEPTYYRGLDWALENKDLHPSKKIMLETNASREISWWKKYSPHFGKVVISFHQHFLSVEHLFFVLETLRELEVDTKIKLPITPKYWDDTIELKQLLWSRGYKSELQILYKNFTKGNNNYYQYSEQQLDFYYTDKNVNPNQIEKQIEFKRIHRLNEYHGHMCWAGVEQFVIDRFGNVYRGWCEQGGSLGNIFGTAIKWPEVPIMCQKYLCSNGFDLEARKSENSWGRL